MAKTFISRKAAQFTESVIREMTRLANQHGAINLAQGFPDFPAPEALKKAACAAIQNDVNQYAISDPRDGRKQVRFAFCKRLETLREAGRRLQKLNTHVKAATVKV